MTVSTTNQPHAHRTSDPFDGRRAANARPIAFASEKSATNLQELAVLNWVVYSALAHVADRPNSIADLGLTGKLRSKFDGAENRKFSPQKSRLRAAISAGRTFASSIRVPVRLRSASGRERPQAFQKSDGDANLRVAPTPIGTARRPMVRVFSINGRSNAAPRVA